MSNGTMPCFTGFMGVNRSSKCIPPIRNMNATGDIFEPTVAEITWLEGEVLEMEKALPVTAFKTEKDAVCHAETTNCSCLSSCGSNYSRNGSCSCLSSCGSNHSKN